MQHDETEHLLQRAAGGELAAIEELFASHRGRLRRLIGTRMHPKLAGRLDPSDVVQDALTDAARRLPQFLKDRPVPFFTWLRQIGLDRLADCRRRHLYAGVRSVFREEDVTLTDDSVAALAARLGSRSSGPSEQITREEQKQRMRACLEQLRPAERELLLMRFVEQLQVGEIAGALGVSESTVKSRVRRALENLQRLLGTAT